MSAEENKEVVQRMIEAFNQRQFDDLEGTVFSPALVYKHNGREADLKQWIQDAKDCVMSFPDAQIIGGEETTSSDRVTASFRFQGTHLGPFRRALPNGRKFDVSGTAAFRIMDGLIVEYFEQIDDAALFQQIGLRTRTNTVLPKEKEGLK